MSEITDRLDEIYEGEIPETKEEFQKIIYEVYNLAVIECCRKIFEDTNNDPGNFKR